MSKQIPKRSTAANSQEDETSTPHRHSIESNRDPIEETKFAESAKP